MPTVLTRRNKVLQYFLCAFGKTNACCRVGVRGQEENIRHDEDHYKREQKSIWRCIHPLKLPPVKKKKWRTFRFTVAMLYNAINVHCFFFQVEAKVLKRFCSRSTCDCVG